MSRDFKGKVAVVAGGTGEMGRTVTRRFVEQGATVVVPFISEMRLNTFLTDQPELAQRVRFDRVDVGHATQTKRFLESVREREGGLDILVNLVGGYAGGTTVAESRPNFFTEMMDLNFKPIHNLCRAAIPLLLERHGGKIINVSSRAGLRGSAGNAAYAAAKSAVIRFSEALADELKRSGINVNCVLPSIIDTADNRRDMPEADASTWVTAEEIADVILFLASDQARALHGVAIPIYGLG